jgi:PIN domain nuclease of toxin-antitoxin system
MLIDDELLSKDVKDIIDDCYKRCVYISAESIKEIIHLLQIGKIHVKQWKSAKDVVNYICDDTMIDIKYIAKEHLETLADLPFFKDHRDPCDRMLIAQAITENLTLISSDEQFPRYRKYGLDLVFNKRK